MKNALFSSLVVAGAILFLACGCGKKGDPFIAQKEFNATVEDLRGAWEGEYIVLRGSVEGIPDLSRAADFTSGARVYYGAYDPAEPPCEGCPVRYHGYHEYGVDVLTENGFICRVPGKIKDGLYFFKVHLMSPDGDPGPPSDRIRVPGL